jgi:hypothetical protein
MAKHLVKQRKSGNDKDSDENLRGLLRESEKTVRSLRSYIKHLERKLNMAESVLDDGNQVPEEDKQPEGKICDKCKDGRMELKSFPKGKEEVHFWICQICYHKEKVTKK